jgi:hypothetical protein
MSLWGDKPSRHKTEERRRHLRRSGLSVSVLVRGPQGCRCKGTVLNVSEGGIGLFMEDWPSSELLEIQPVGSPLWISVLAKHCNSVPVGYLVGCVFQVAPTSDILEALYSSRSSE